MNLIEMCSLLGILDGVLAGFIVGKEHGIWGGVTGAAIGLVVGIGSIFALPKITRVLDQTVFTHPFFHTRFERKWLEWVIVFLWLGVQGFVNLVYLILVGCLSGYVTYFAWRL